MEPWQKHRRKCCPISSQVVINMVAMGVILFSEMVEPNVLSSEGEMDLESRRDDSLALHFLPTCSTGLEVVVSLCKESKGIALPHFHHVLAHRDQQALQVRP